MISDPDFVIWVLSILLNAFVCALMVIRKEARKYAALWLYFAARAIIGVSGVYVLARNGLTSREYAYWWYCSEAVFAIALYLAVADLYHKIVRTDDAQAVVQRSKFLVLFFVGIYSLAKATSSGSPTARLMVAYEQALSFVSAIAAMGLFYPRLWNGRAPMRVYQISFVVGAYFLFVLAELTTWSLYPGYKIWWWRLPHYAWLLLPVGAAYVFSNKESVDDVPRMRL